MEASPQDLVLRARRRDAAAFEALIRRYERVALSVAFGIVGDAAGPSDVVQDGFIRAWQRLADLKEPERFGAWLCGIVRHLARDARRRTKREVRQFTTTGTTGSDGEETPLLRLVGSETEAEKEVRVLHFIDACGRIRAGLIVILKNIA